MGMIEGRPIAQIRFVGAEFGRRAGSVSGGVPCVRPAAAVGGAAVR